MIERGQIMIWDMGKSSSHWNARQLENRHSFAGIGIIDVEVGFFNEEVMRGFVSFGHGPSMELQLTDYCRTHQADASEMGSYATENIWPRPDATTGLSGGGILFRRTRMKAAPGREIMFALMVMALPAGSLKDRHLYNLTGWISRWPSEDYVSERAGRMQLCDPIPAEDLVPSGNNLGQLLKFPVWGWDEEKVAFTSTMPLKQLDRCQRIDNLLSQGDRTAEQDQELARLLRTSAGGIFSVSRGDIQYAQFRKRLLEERGPPIWGEVITASEAEARSVQASRIVREIMDEPLAV